MPNMLRISSAFAKFSERLAAYLQHLDFPNYTDSHPIILCYLIPIDKLDGDQIILLLNLTLSTV
jgi:hypothetical protein